MFLCLSSNNQDWDKEQKLILLGPWCIKDNEKINDYDYELLPYHWENDEKFQKDLNFLFTLYKDLIPEVALILNQKNNKNFSNKYWEILIGPWLWSFIQALFDRYSSLKIAVDKYKDLETKVTDSLFSPKTF